MALQVQQAVREQVALAQQELWAQLVLLDQLAQAELVEQRELLARLAQRELTVLQAIRGLAVLLGQPAQVAQQVQREQQD
jgi:hypothetical protein